MRLAAFGLMARHIFRGLGSLRPGPSPPYVQASEPGCWWGVGAYSSRS